MDPLLQPKEPVHLSSDSSLMPSTEPSKVLSPIESVTIPILQKGHEGNDIGVNKLDPLSVKEQNEEVDKKSCSLWKCLDRQAVDTGGYIYKFRLRNPYKNIEAMLAKNNALFPATQCIINASNTGIDEEQFFPQDKDPSLLSFQDLQFRQLGYLWERVGDDNFIYLPDREAILGRWGQVQKNGGTLEIPDLKICSSQGIATDGEFVEAQCQYDVLLSEGPEFIHDHLFHVRLVILRILSSGEGGKAPYAEIREKYVSMLEPLLLQVDKIKKRMEENPDEKGALSIKVQVFEKLLGALADSISASIHTINPSYFNNPKLRLQKLSAAIGWNDYFRRTLGPAFDAFDLEAFWNEFIDVIPRPVE